MMMLSKILLNLEYPKAKQNSVFVLFPTIWNWQRYKLQVPFVTNF